MAKQEREFFPAEEVPWEPDPVVKGLYQRIISRDPEAGDYTRLLRFDPGTDTSPAGTQNHAF